MNGHVPNWCEYAICVDYGKYECCCFKGMDCKDRVYDYNPDGSINIVTCGYVKNLAKALRRAGEVD